MNKIPKDRQIIITHNYGKSVAIWSVAIWSEADKKFVYAIVQTDLYNGEWNMTYYFENKCIEENEIESWSELESTKLAPNRAVKKT